MALYKPSASKLRSPVGRIGIGNSSAVKIPAGPRALNFKSYAPKIGK